MGGYDGEDAGLAKMQKQSFCGVAEPTYRLANLNPKLMKLMKPVLLVATGLFALGAVACDRKETVLDVDTPGGELKVEKDKDTGAVNVEIDGDGE